MRGAPLSEALCWVKQRSTSLRRAAKARVRALTPSGFLAGWAALAASFAVLSVARRGAAGAAATASPARAQRMEAPLPAPARAARRRRPRGPPSTRVAKKATAKRPPVQAAMSKTRVPSELLALAGAAALASPAVLGEPRPTAWEPKPVRSAPGKGRERLCRGQVAPGAIHLAELHGLGHRREALGRRSPCAPRASGARAARPGRAGRRGAGPPTARAPRRGARQDPWTARARSRRRRRR
jgi:hypothetical protein